MLRRMNLGLAVVHRFRHPWLQYLYRVLAALFFQVLFLHVPCSSSVFLSHHATWCPVDRLIYVRIRMRWSRVMWKYPLEWHLFLPIQTSTFNRLTAHVLFTEPSTHPDTLDFRFCMESLAAPIFQFSFFMSHVPVRFSFHFLLLAAQQIVSSMWGFGWNEAESSGIVSFQFQ